MANPEHLEILKQGVEIWNKWRAESQVEEPDLGLATLEDYFSSIKFQTFGKLGHSQKLLLLHVPKIGKIDKPTCKEKVDYAFKEKKRLTKMAVKEKYSVRAFRDYLKTEFPSHQKQNTKTLLKRHEKQLIKMLSQARDQIQPDGPLAGAYENVLSQIETLLGEIKKAAKAQK